MCLKSKHLTPKSAKEKQNEENKTCMLQNSGIVQEKDDFVS